jgi:hypothetical protein
MIRTTILSAAMLLLAAPLVIAQGSGLAVCFGLNEASNSFNYYPLPIGTRVGVSFIPPFATSVEEVDWYGPLIAPTSVSISGFIVEIRTPDPVTGLPSNNVLASTVASTFYPSPNGQGWQDGNFGTPVILSPTMTYWVTFTSSSTSTTAPPISIGVENTPPGPDLTPYSLEINGTWGPIMTDTRFKIRFESTNCSAVPAADYQVNQAAASLTINGVTGTAWAPAAPILGIGQSGILVLTSTNTGLPWELVLGTAPLISASQGAPVGPEAQVVNVDLSDPTLLLLWNGFAGPGFQNVGLPFTSPAATAVSLQLAVIDGAAAIGIRLSQPTRLTVQ